MHYSSRILDFWEDIENFIDGSKSPGKQWIEEMTKRYPYFTLPLLLQAKQNGDKKTLEQLALLSPDRRDLAIVVGHTPESFANFYPEQAPSAQQGVEDVIDKFLETYSHGYNQKEIDALSSAIFNPTPDYADILAAQDNGESVNDNEDSLITSFIQHSREKEREALSREPVVAQHLQHEKVEEAAHDQVQNSTQNDSSLLSESLAKVYIARGKYLKALEIIESINLNFPEKSIYFADQIRFLRKLVLNETTKNKL